MDIDAEDVLRSMGNIVGELAQRLAVTEAREVQHMNRIKELEEEVKQMEEELDGRTDVDMVSAGVSAVPDHPTGGA